MNNPWFWLYFVIGVIFLAMIPVVAKRIYYKRMMKALHEGNLDQYETDLDSFWAKMGFSAFEREMMRLSLYEMKHNMPECDKQVQFIEHMRLNRKQRAQLGERGFYIYLEQGKIRKAKRMVELLKQYGSDKQVENVEIQYSILLAKESKYIDVLKQRIDGLKGADGKVPEGLRMNAGIFSYLIALQYSYLKEWKDCKAWALKAKPALANTPYALDVQKLLDQCPAKV